MSSGAIAERLPGPASGPFITDGGIETTLIFHRGLELPSFASFVLLDDDEGVRALRDYYAPYVSLAREYGVGLVLESPTWRANPDWGALLGYSAAELDSVNRRAIALIDEIRAENEDAPGPTVLSGCIGPRGDGYAPSELMTAAEAERYHATQIGTFAETPAELVTALTMTYSAEAIGIVRAAGAAQMPAVISFTVETDGRLPSGQPLGEAIEEVDSESGGAALYFMINCAHPKHFADALAEGEPWLDRLGGLRVNASSKSHAELDEAGELDEGDPVELGAQHGAIRPRLRFANVVGGCCGTDHRHVKEICEVWLAKRPA